MAPHQLLASDVSTLAVALWWLVPSTFGLSGAFWAVKRPRGEKINRKWRTKSKNNNIIIRWLEWTCAALNKMSSRGLWRRRHCVFVCHKSEGQNVFRIVSFMCVSGREFESVSSSIKKSGRGTNTFQGGKNKEIKIKGERRWKWALSLFLAALQRTLHNVSPSWVKHFHHPQPFRETSRSRPSSSASTLPHPPRLKL